MADQTHRFSEAVAAVQSGADARHEAAALVAEMTLDEKLDCLDGDIDFWAGIGDMSSGGYHRHPWPAAAVERLGIPGLQFVDGPRGCVVGPSTCFPVAMARGASFDPSLEERIGEVIGLEIRAIGGNYTGAVCVNLLRHPGWGRAQETYGEDPHHVGELGAALTRGLQRHVMACMKHFALNSMENARFTVDVTCDERALHEVYLPHYRRIAAEGVASVMSAYNSVNGTWAGENRTLLCDVLRGEWFFDGFVITDFVFGLRDPVASVEAGCDIEMPFRQQRAHALAAAITDGWLDEKTIDASVVTIVSTFLRFAHVFGERPDASVLAAPAHRALAREAAIESMVLVRNDGLLPVDVGTVRRVAVLGELAGRPNLGDGGSSNVFPPEVITPLDGIRAAFPDAEVLHSDHDVSVVDGVDLAVVVVGYTKADEGEFLGQDMSTLMTLFPPMSDPPPEPYVAPEVFEVVSHDDGPGGFSSPGGDRRSLRLSDEHERLIERAVARSGNVVVAIESGSAVVMPWLEQVRAAICLWYPGMEGGAALADVLTGAAEPGGRLPFAVPRKESDLVEFDPDAAEATYGLLHGQWFLDANGVEPQLPFGFGLGYTSIELVDSVCHHDATVGEIKLRARNDGDRAGSTVVQVYGSLPGSALERPKRRLVGFKKVHLGPHESHEVVVPFDLATLAVRDSNWWKQEPGRYRIEVGRSASDIVASHTVTLD